VVDIRRPLFFRVHALPLFETSRRAYTRGVQSLALKKDITK